MWRRDWKQGTLLVKVCLAFNHIREKYTSHISPYISMQDAMKSHITDSSKSPYLQNAKEMKADNGDREYQDRRSMGHTSTRSWRSLLTISNPHKDTKMNLLHRWSHLKIRCLRCGSTALTCILYQIHLTYDGNCFAPNTSLLSWNISAGPKMHLKAQDSWQQHIRK